MLGNVIMDITTKISKATEELVEKVELSKTGEIGEKTENNHRESVFKLPIEYLDESEKYVLQETVCDDLELSCKCKEVDSKNEDNKTMYHYLFNPINEFALQMIPKWRTSITTNTDFLGETQNITKSMATYKQSEKQITTYTPDYNKMMEIWNDTKEDPNFLERYSYMELSMFKSLNKMPSFLQAISLINMGSPILSFLIPFVLFLFPFFILKIQGIPITFDVYLTVLKEISRNHFIGKLISNVQNMSLQNIIYTIVLIGLYGYQIYQNYVSCIRFYKNINRINEQICEMQKYVDYSISSMNRFAKIIENKPTYALFHVDLLSHIKTFEHLKDQIKHVCPFIPSFTKIGEIGLLLGCYYEIHSNIEYEKSLKYSFEFEGFISNLLGVYENLKNGKIGSSEFYTDTSSNSLMIKQQYYPALIDENYVSNDASIDKNMIITGPNAAGKTTYLKATIINIIFTQQFGFGFYSSCKMKPYTHIHSYLNIPDTSGRDSLFQAESRRCKEILNIINTSSDYCSRHFCIFDELYSGTNPNEATKSAFSFLLYLSNYENVDFILTTHYVDICNRLKKASNNRIENWKMNADSNENGEIQYNYTISKGISTIQGAIKVLRDMEYPNEIIQSMIEYDYAVVESRVLDAVESRVLDTVESPVLDAESPVLDAETPVLETATKEPKKKRNRKQK
jgi:hypothetical protein